MNYYTKSPVEIVNYLNFFEQTKSQTIVYSKRKILERDDGKELKGKALVQDKPNPRLEVSPVGSIGNLQMY